MTRSPENAAACSIQYFAALPCRTQPKVARKVRNGNTQWYQDKLVLQGSALWNAHHDDRSPQPNSAAIGAKCLHLKTQRLRSWQVKRIEKKETERRHGLLKPGMTRRGKLPDHSAAFTKQKQNTKSGLVLCCGKSPYGTQDRTLHELRIDRMATGKEGKYDTLKR